MEKLPFQIYDILSARILTEWKRYDLTLQHGAPEIHPVGKGPCRLLLIHSTDGVYVEKDS